MISDTPPICSLCRHFVPGQANPTCRAYPDGIPNEILRGEELHETQIGTEPVWFEPAEGISDEEINDLRQTLLARRKQAAVAGMEEPPDAQVDSE